MLLCVLRGQKSEAKQTRNCVLTALLLKASAQRHYQFTQWWSERGGGAVEGCELRNGKRLERMVGRQQRGKYVCKAEHIEIEERLLQPYGVNIYHLHPRECHCIRVPQSGYKFFNTYTSYCWLLCIQGFSPSSCCSLYTHQYYIRVCVSVVEKSTKQAQQVSTSEQPTNVR